MASPSKSRRNHHRISRSGSPRDYRLGLKDNAAIFAALWRPEEEFMISQFVAILCKGRRRRARIVTRYDLDERGHLSEETLTQFTSFFLTTRIDQVTFTENLMQPDQLRTRILLWAEEEIRMGRPQQTFCLCPDRSGRDYVRKHARALAPRLPRRNRLTLDARIVSGEDGLTLTCGAPPPLSVAHPDCKNKIDSAGVVKGMRIRSQIDVAG